MIRPAQKEDFGELARMGRAFVDIAYGGNFDPDSFIKQVISMMNGTGVVFIMEVNGQVVGAAGALVYPKWFNHSIKVAQEVFWWVDEAHRGQLMSVRLFDAIDRWMMDSEATEHIVSNNATIEPEKAARFYQHRGFVWSESNFVRRLHHA